MAWLSKFIGPDLHFLWNDAVMHVNKYQPSLIPVKVKQHYYKERYNLEHYLHSTEVVKCTCVIHFCISSVKDRRWPQPLFKYYIVYKATVRHNSQTIVTFKGDNSLKSVERFDHLMFVCRFEASRWSKPQREKLLCG